MMMSYVDLCQSLVKHCTECGRQHIELAACTYKNPMADAPSFMLLNNLTSSISCWFHASSITILLFSPIIRPTTISISIFTCEAMVLHKDK